MSWPPHHIDTLRSLWPTHSAAEIAATLGTVSRSAVLGMAHRLKLGAKRAPPRPQAVRTTPFRKLKPPIEQPAPPLVPELHVEPITLIELTHKTCRYQIGDRVPYLFCGALPMEESSYCRAHHGSTHYPPKLR